MKSVMQKQSTRQRRHHRVRAKIFGTKARPRLCVFRSAVHTYAQIIDDGSGKTLVTAGSLKVKADKQNKTDIARAVGKKLAEQAAAKGIKQVSFDRGGYAYHGRIKALAEGAREGGLIF